MSKRLLALAALLAAGCANAPGTGFATLQPGGLGAVFPVGNGRAEGSGLKTDNGYVIQLDDQALTTTVKDVELQAPGQAGAAAQGGTFDPANPPPGYSLCHGGHCHGTDGSEKTYEEIQAELAGGGASLPTRLLRLTPTSPALKLVPGQRAELTFAGCAPSCELPRGQVSRAPLHLAALSASGKVSALAGIAALAGGTRGWKLELKDLTLAGPSLNVKLDRDQPARLTFGGSLTLSERLLDGIEWERLASQPDPIQLDADEATRDTILENLGEWKPELVTTP